MTPFAIAELASFSEGGEILLLEGFLPTLLAAPLLLSAGPGIVD